MFASGPSCTNHNNRQENNQYKDCCLDWVSGYGSSSKHWRIQEEVLDRGTVSRLEVAKAASYNKKALGKRDRYVVKLSNFGMHLQDRASEPQLAAPAPTAILGTLDNGVPDR